MKSYTVPAILAMASTSLAAAITPQPMFVPHLGKREGTCPDGQLDIQIQSYVSTWYYTFDGRVWGSGSGKGGSVGGLCVPANANAGGALYIGPNPNPGPGSTKFECYFDDTGKGNCDVSLVDGYSLSMTCGQLDGSGQQVGGDLPLFSQGNACPQTNSEGDCVNTQGYADSQSDVDAFFQPAVNNGNNYCIWVNCAQDYPYDVNTGFSCLINPGS